MIFLDIKFIFDIELLLWCSVKDVIRDGGVMKKVVCEGKLWERLKEVDEVKGEVFIFYKYCIFLEFCDCCGCFFFL